MRSLKQPRIRVRSINIFLKQRKRRRRKRILNRMGISDGEALKKVLMGEERKKIISVTLIFNTNLTKLNLFKVSRRSNV